MGITNCKKELCINFPFTSFKSYTFDDIGLLLVPGNAVDVGVSAIIAPRNGQVETSPENVTVVVSNYGLTNVTNIPLYFKVNDSATVGPFYLPFLMVNSNVTFTFPIRVNLTVPDTYSISAWTSVTSDIDRSNDQTTKIVVKTAPTMPLPWFEGFESVLTNHILGSNQTLNSASCSFSTNGINGRLRTNAFVYEGSKSVTLDRDSYSADSVSRSNLICFINLNGYHAQSTNIRLSFAFVSSGGISPDPNNKIWVKESWNDDWLELLDLNTKQGTIGSWHVFDMSLSYFMLTRQKDFSNSFQIKFGYGGQDSAGPAIWEKSGSR